MESQRLDDIFSQCWLNGLVDFSIKEMWVNVYKSEKSICY